MTNLGPTGAEFRTVSDDMDDLCWRRFEESHKSKSKTQLPKMFDYADGKEPKIFATEHAAPTKPGWYYASRLDGPIMPTRVEKFDVLDELLAVTYGYGPIYLNGFRWFAAVRECVEA